MAELIVDGYNIVHAWPELAPLIKSGQAEEARRRLIDMLAGYSAATGEHVTVVFDAHGRARNHGAGEQIDGVTVVFGSKGQTADHVIERRVSIASHRGDARSVTVATGDRLQRDLVMAMGASVIGPEALRQLVRGAQADMDRHNSRRGSESSFANRLEGRIDPEVRRRLERLRRPDSGPADTGDDHGGNG
ncbi:MAG: NYN domain-containing protein [Candidatus Dormibacteraeota bacterium]|uniref:NYN domain-containing protein n=1 Tax=Candidatus Aeolococcus gillhamiae TaxID=3127015 RepID=A0A934K044_9BACT|nr:NYN domain-containing protein [Candidatus Dormibacteraeota bacterium]